MCCTFERVNVIYGLHCIVGYVPVHGAGYGICSWQTSCAEVTRFETCAATLYAIISIHTVLKQNSENGWFYCFISRTNGNKTERSLIKIFNRFGYYFIASQPLIRILITVWREKKFRFTSGFCLLILCECVLRRSFNYYICLRCNTARHQNEYLMSINCFFIVEMELFQSFSKYVLESTFKKTMRLTIDSANTLLTNEMLFLRNFTL